MSAAASPERRVLVLGAGRVSRSVVRYFLERAGYRVTAGNLYVEEAEAVIEQHPRGVTVSLPAAIAGRLMLEGGLELTGVHVPVEPAIYGSVLDEMAGLGIDFRERTERLD